MISLFYYLVYPLNLLSPLLMGADFMSWLTIVCVINSPEPKRSISPLDKIGNYRISAF